MCDGGAPDVLHWTSHPLRDQPPAKSAALVAILAALTAAVDLTFPGHLYSALTFGLLVACMSRYFAPTRYACEPEGLVESHLGRRRTIKWTDVGRVVVFPDGLFLSPFERPSRLDRFRGTYVRTPGNGREVEAAVRRRVRDASPTRPGPRSE